MNPRYLHAIVVAAFLCTSSSCELFKEGDNSCENFDDAPGGSPADYPLAAGGSLGTVQVMIPQVCDKQEGYIRLERAEGKRRLGEPAKPGVPTTGCLELPSNPQDLAQCPVIAPAAILHQSDRELQAKGMLINGIGDAPCVDAGDPNERELSISVTTWGDVQEAVTLVASLLERYDLQGVVRVGVRGIACAHPKAR